MLYIPEGSSPTGVIVGIDPGSNTFGVAKLEFDLSTFEIKGIYATTFIAEHMSCSPFIEQRDGARFSRIKALEKAMVDYFRKCSPFTIATESPFHNHLRPNAFGVLMEVMSGIRSAVNSYDQQMELVLIPPSNVKNAVNAHGAAKKEAMRIAIGNLFQGLTEFPLDFYDEHSLDAIAVAYARYKMFIEEHLVKKETKKRTR